MTIPDTLVALRAKTITRETAIERIIPELDRVLAFDLLPVVGGVVEAVSDQFLRPIAVLIVGTAQRAWAKERKG